MVIWTLTHHMVDTNSIVYKVKLILYDTIPAMTDICRPLRGILQLIPGIHTIVTDQCSRIPEPKLRVPITARIAPDLCPKQPVLKVNSTKFYVIVPRVAEADPISAGQEVLKRVLALKDLGVGNRGVGNV